MRRRGFLTAALSTVVAGCLGERPPSGPRHPPSGGTPPGSGPETATPSPGLRLADRDFSERENGGLLVEATIENTASETRTGTLVVTATTPEEEATETRDLEVDPGSEIDVAVEFELTYGEFINGGSLSFDIET
ncbi:hypothetical protein ACFQAS_05180 [Halopenitus salinus]|jgi:hypothetical protein|uniref:Transcriptional initiation protein Tat n=1 Tax=Halopenitus salinus TaxID=1198295 RepID=A0ABD5UW83_9EURY